MKSYKGMSEYRARIRRRWYVGLALTVAIFVVMMIMIRIFHTNIPTTDQTVILVKMYTTALLSLIIGFGARSMFLDNLDANVLQAGPAERKRLIAILEESLELDEREDPVDQ